jgi:tetratricopeptide (TPR) repeat protein
MLKARGTPTDAVRPLINLGSVLERQGKYTEAVDMLREATSLSTRTLGRENLYTLYAMNNLAHALHQTEQFEEAERLQREVLAIRQKMLGDTHHDVGVARYNLANTLGDLGRLDEAAAMFRESVATLNSVFPGGHHQAGWALSDWGSVELKRGRLEDSERLQREALAMFVKIGGDPTNVGKAWFGLGEVFQRRGQLAEARKYFQMDLDVLQKHSAAPSIQAWPETALARVLVEQGEPAKAEPMARHAVESLRSSLPAGHQRTVLAEIVLGASLAAQRKFEEAEPLLVNGFRALEAKAGRDNEATRYTIGRLVQLYEAWNRRDEASKWRQLLASDR